MLSIGMECVVCCVSDISRCSVHRVLPPSLIAECLNSCVHKQVTIMKSQYETCLMHILSKALPRRCQIRELARFMMKYLKIHPILDILFSRMMLLSLLNLYPMRTEWAVRMQGEGYYTNCSDSFLKKKTFDKGSWVGPVQFTLVVQLYSLFYLNLNAHKSDSMSDSPLWGILSTSNNKKYTSQCQVRAGLFNSFKYTPLSDLCFGGTGFILLHYPGVCCVSSPKTPSSKGRLEYHVQLAAV